jgi:nitric oxide reductase NorE protein
MGNILEDGVSRHVRRLPGEPGIWVFVLLDMMIFAEMFGVFVWYRAQNREAFASAAHAISPVYGLVYTLLLLTSSWCVVMAVNAARENRSKFSVTSASWAIALGAAFIAVKLVEYGGKLGAGITPVTNDFFMFYFVLTLVHLLHASVGVGVLVYVRKQLAATPLRSPDSNRVRLIEAGGIYWHMVDLLWIVLFALFYLRG